MVACGSWFLLSSGGELAHQTGLDGRALEVMCCRDSPLVPPSGRGYLVQGFTPGVDPTRSVGGRGHVLQGLSCGSFKWQKLAWSRDSLQV